MIRNFLFHRVNPERDRLWDPMDVALFERCIQYITKHYTVVLMEELAFSPDLYSGKKIATIMFDDGYKDNIEYALPVLTKYNCKASFYVVTDCIDNNIPTWTYMLEHAFQHNNLADVSFDFDFLPPGLRVKELLHQEDRIQYAIKLKPFLKNLPHEQRQQVLDSINASVTGNVLPARMMNWDDLRTLRQCGHYVGSHTVSHPMLGTMSSDADIRYELQHSAERIRQELGYFPVTISYPIGSFNARVKTLSKEAGYRIGLAVKQTTFDPHTEDLFEVPRIELYNDPWWKTWLRITNILKRIKTITG